MSEAFKLTQEEIEAELNSLPKEMLAEMSNGLEEGESPLSAKAAGLGAALSAKIAAKGYTNSSLATLKLISPNSSNPRNHTIDRITPHHTAGVLSVESALEWFHKTSTQASCNYIIGNDGRIGLCVEEKNRPWTSSSRLNDNRAITYEVCNSGWEKDGWPISDRSFDSVVMLSTDICKRYGKKKLLWIPDKDKALAYEPKSDEMLLTVHNWFNNTNCPGKYFQNKFPELASRVTAALNKSAEEDEEEMVRFKTIDEMPKYYHEDVKKLVEAGYIKGRAADNLDVTEDMIRVAIWIGRMNGFLK